MKAWRQRLHEIIYEVDTPAGKAFDVTLITLTVLSVVTVSLESVESRPRVQPKLHQIRVGQAHNRASEKRELVDGHSINPCLVLLSVNKTNE